MSTRATLLASLDEVKAELQALTLRIADLEAQLAATEDFEVVGTTAAGSSAGDIGGEARTAAAASRSGRIPSDRDREEAALQTGRFFGRALRGEPRGDSGRSRVKLQARHYVVIRSFLGEVYTNPVRVFTSFSEVRSLVAEGGHSHQFGDSIFAGFASLW